MKFVLKYSNFYSRKRIWNVCKRRQVCVGLSISWYVRTGVDGSRVARNIRVDSPLDPGHAWLFYRDRRWQDERVTNKWAWQLRIGNDHCRYANWVLVYAYLSSSLGVGIYSCGNVKMSFKQYICRMARQWMNLFWSWRYHWIFFTLRDELWICALLTCTPNKRHLSMLNCF